MFNAEKLLFNNITRHDEKFQIASLHVYFLFILNWSKINCISWFSHLIQSNIQTVNLQHKKKNVSSFNHKFLTSLLLKKVRFYWLQCYKMSKTKQLVNDMNFFFHKIHPV